MYIKVKYLIFFLLFVAPAVFAQNTGIYVVPVNLQITGANAGALQGVPINTVLPGVGQCLIYDGTQASWGNCGGSSGLSFSVITAGINTTALLVGTGGSLGTTGTGTINATAWGGVTITGTPGVGQCPIAASGTTAAWGTCGSGTGTLTNFSVSGSTSPFFTTNVTNPTTAPNLAFTITPQNANCVFSGPSSGGAAVPTCRALATADIPVIAIGNTPLTTNGDVLTVIAGALARLGQGANGTFLGVSGGTLGYYTPSGAGNVSAGGTLALNQLVIGQGTTNVATLGTLGTTTTVLHGNAGGIPTFSAVNFSTDMIGNILLANMASGTGASINTFFRGDNSWAAPSVTWNGISNPTGNLTLTMGTNTSTFNQTTAATWLWANVTNAVSGVPQSSPILSLRGTYFTGATSANDSFSMQVVESTTSNGPSTFTFTHSGSSGIAAVSMPNLILTGFTSPGLCLSTSSTGLIGTTACGSGGSTLTVNGGASIGSPNLQNNSTGYNGMFVNVTQSGSNVNWILNGTLGIAAGGTGQVSAIAGFNALSPLNTEGDILYYHTGTASRLAVGSNGQCFTSNGTDPLWASCPGGLSNPMTTFGDFIVGGTAGAATRLAGPSAINNVPYVLTSTPAAGLATAQGWNLAGVPVNVQSGTAYTLGTTDRASEIDFTGTSNINVTIPLISTAGFGGNNVFVFGNQRGTASAFLIPTSPNTFNGASAAESIRPGWGALVYQNNAGTNWIDLNFPTVTAFPAAGCSILSWSGLPTGTFGCNTAPAAGTVPFSGILTGINTGAIMTMTSSASLVASGTATVNLSGMTTAGFQMPAFSGAAPIALGGFAYDTASQTLRATVSGATNLVPTVAGISLPVNGHCAQWGPNATLTSAASACGTGTGGGGQINYPVAATVRVDPFGFSITGATTVANTGAATTLIGQSVGRQTVNAGSLMPYTNGSKTIKIHGVGTISTAGSNFGLTMTISLAGVTLSTITFPTVASLSSAGWELNYDLTVNSLTSANVGGCVHIVGTSNADLISCASSGAVTGLAFATNQLVDMQVTWATGSASNTITVNSLTGNVDQGF